MSAPDSPEMSLHGWNEKYADSEGMAAAMMFLCAISVIKRKKREAVLDAMMQISTRPAQDAGTIRLGPGVTHLGALMQPQVAARAAAILKAIFVSAHCVDSPFDVHRIPRRKAP
jgi:hypothetical protein